ncbi:magnesium transporter [Christensenellaceae bacterium OttesenSCG-928-K19]|nr:magnesium transporter [Christensenellaceae bacterium OttesenSCG-928-K19]
MLAFLNGKRIDDHSLLENSEKNILCFAEKREEALLLPKLFPSRATPNDKAADGNYFESHEDFDYIYIKVPAAKDLSTASGIAEIYFAASKLIFILNKTKVSESFIQEIENNLDKLTNLDNVLYHFFVKLTETDELGLEAIEEKVIAMEDAVTTESDNDFYASIGVLRKELLKLKRYYESLVDLFEDMEENRNHFLSENTLNSLHFQANRVDRLYHDVLNLRDYVTQVREAYQAQVDITLNKTMRFFTVIATIFLPLTLVVGWYGMNLRMPEYDAEFSYPVVIVICAAIVIISIAYFKKKKWF